MIAMATIRLVRVAVSAGQVDPWSLAERFDLAFLWDDCETGVALAAFGALALGDRSALRSCSTLAEQATAVVRAARLLLAEDAAVAAELPLALVALPFWDEAPGMEDVARLGCWLPRLLAVRAGGETTLIAHGLAERGAPAEELRAALGQDLAAWGRTRRSIVHAARRPGADRLEGAEVERAGFEVERAGFVTAVTHALAAIERGELAKVVMARCATVSAEPGMRFDALAQARALREDRDGAIVFALLGGVAHGFVGKTPEVLLRLAGNRLTTAALAGTTASDRSAMNDGSAVAAGMLMDEKLRREHAVVVVDMLEALAPLAEWVHAADEPRVVRAGAVAHLETSIEARLSAGVGASSGVGALAARAALHPTAALGGSPRTEALAFLRRHETRDRGLFGGNIGWVAPNGDAVLAVAIRAALLDGTRALAWAGAGIVQGSQPNEEWLETEQKLDTALGSLRLIEERELAGGDARVDARVDACCAEGVDGVGARA
ncbi:MAG: isochorismate synthase [Myxococcales bacterium]|nr:isochorismate synthase [Myxococcales bacterium]